MSYRDLLRHTFQLELVCCARDPRGGNINIITKRFGQIPSMTATEATLQHSPWSEPNCRCEALIGATDAMLMLVMWTVAI